MGKAAAYGTVCILNFTTTQLNSGKRYVILIIVRRSVHSLLQKPRCLSVTRQACINIAEQP